MVVPSTVGSPTTMFAAAARARDPKAFLAINPGAGTCESYLGLFDVIVTAESSASDYANYKRPAWTRNYNRNRFWHLVYGISSNEMQSTVQKAAGNGAGWVYVTSENQPNPWNALPSWLPEEITAAKTTP